MHPVKTGVERYPRDQFGQRSQTRTGRGLDGPSCSAKAAIENRRESFTDVNLACTETQGTGQFGLNQYYSAVVRIAFYIRQD